MNEGLGAICFEARLEPVASDTGTGGSSGEMSVFVFLLV